MGRKKNKDPRRNKNWERTKRPDLTPGEMLYDDKKFSLNAIYEKMLFADTAVALDCFRALAIKKQQLPSFDEFSLELIIELNFKEEFKKLLMQPKKHAELLSNIKRFVMPQIARRYNTELSARSDPAIMFDNSVLRFVQSLESEYLLVRKDDTIYHLADTRLLPEGNIYAEVLAKCVAALDQDEFYLHYLLYGFGEIIRHSHGDECDLTVEERNKMLDWYLIDKGLRDNRVASKAIADLLYQISQSPEAGDADFALEVYEDHEESFSMIFARNPEFNFVIQGKAVEYDSLDDFIKSSPETADMFVEAADTGKHGGSGGGRGKRRRREATPEELNHILMVKEAMSNIFDAAQKVGTELHVLNILKNSIKKAGTDLALPSTSGSYVAVAFKYNGEHWILADTVKLGGGAVYLWHGTSYNDGLEVYKKAHSVARQEASVNTRNHVYTRRTLLEIYQELLKAQGVAL